jgi:hypothetical protein
MTMYPVCEPHLVCTCGVIESRCIDKSEEPQQCHPSVVEDVDEGGGGGDHHDLLVWAVADGLKTTTWTNVRNENDGMIQCKVEKLEKCSIEVPF